jgi:hypothetical protein
MYTVIRDGTRVSPTPDEVVKRASGSSARCSRDGRIQGYYLVKEGGGVVATISVFESKDEDRRLGRGRADWVRDRLADMLPNAPQVTSGETTGINP